MKKEKKTPFFAKLLDEQAKAEVKGGAEKTMKYPSDNDEVMQTMKYPSDNDEDIFHDIKW